MRFQMRDGARIRCRLVDAGSLLSVSVDRDYDVPGVDWRSFKTIVDIGAHVGAFTIWAALRSPDARILAIEPNPETFVQLVSNISENSLDDRVTAVNVAIGPKEGTGALELLNHSLGSRLSRTGVGEVAVRVETVASVLGAATIDRVDMLKVDCEGMEYEIFRSMSGRELSAITTIACEYHPRPGNAVAELDERLGAAGFKVKRSDSHVGVIWATR